MLKRKNKTFFNGQLTALFVSLFIQSTHSGFHSFTTINCSKTGLRNETLSNWHIDVKSLMTKFRHFCLKIMHLFRVLADVDLRETLMSASMAPWCCTSCLYSMSYQLNGQIESENEFTSKNKLYSLVHNNLQCNNATPPKLECVFTSCWSEAG